MAKGFMGPACTSAERKESPTFRGVVRYFPAALELVGRLSKIGNDKHNPGEDMHHSRGKSNDHGDCILRHQVDAGSIDADSGLDHAVAVAWRALAQLQELAEKQYGWPLAPGAKLPEAAESGLPDRTNPQPGDRFSSHGSELVVERRFAKGGQHNGCNIGLDHVWFTNGTWLSVPFGAHYKPLTKI